MLSMAQVFFQSIQDYLKMPGIAEEIGIAGVYENGLYVVLFDIINVCLLDMEQVCVGNGLLVCPVPFPDILLQRVDWCMEVDKDIRLYQLGMNDIENLLIEVELLFRKIDLGEEEAFGEQVIRDGDALEHILGMHQLFQLLVPFRHEKELQWECVLGGILIKFGQERIICELFQDQPCVEMFG